MNTKFKDIPVEEGTTIIASIVANISCYAVVYQKWFWDEIYAESIVFFNEDIIKLSEQQIKNEVENTGLLNDNSQMTFKKDEKYTFVNFNFVLD